jgi:Spy/CpxP family protein refolding chaperone
MKRTGIFLIVMLAGTMAGPVDALQGSRGSDRMMQDCPMGTGMRAMDRQAERRMDESWMQRMGIRGEQRSRMMAMNQEFRESQDAHRERLMTMQREMERLMAMDPPDEDAIRGLHQRMGEEERAMLMNHARWRNQIHEMLTPEQRERMRTPE